MDYRCYPCLLKAFTKLIEEHCIDENNKESITREFISHMVDTPTGIIAPEIARISQYKIKEILGVNDPYKKIKEHSNQYLLDRYESFKQKIELSNDKFDTAIRFAIAGNIIDYAANTDFNIDKTINKVLEDKYAIDNTKELEKRI